MKKLFLVDVSSLFFRAFYAVRPLTSPSGIPVNAVYGFLTMILKLLKEEKPEYLVFSRLISWQSQELLKLSHILLIVEWNFLQLVTLAQVIDI